MKKRGRVSSLTKTVTESICTNIKAGLTVKMACILAGVSEPTYYRWMARGAEPGRGIYQDFREAISDAQEYAKNHALRMLQELARGGKPVVKVQTKKDSSGNVIGYVETREETLPSFQALAWMLERRWPQEFGPRRLIELSNGENPFEVSLFGASVLPGSEETELVEPETED